MSKDVAAAAEETEAAPKGVRAKLQAYKDAHQGTDTVTLPKTGIEVTFPMFRPHELMMKAAALAKRNAQRMQLIYIQQNCLFDGEKLTVSDIEKLVPDDDTAVLIKKFFVEDEDEEGNAAAV